MSELENTPEQQEPTASAPEGTNETSSEGAGTNAAAESTPESSAAPASAEPSTESADAGEEQAAPATPSETPADAAGSEPSAPPAAAEENAAPEAASGDATSAEAAPSEAGEGVAGESGGETPATEGGEEGSEDGKGAGRGGARAWRPPRMNKEEMRTVWNELSEVKQKGESVELEVVGHNRGGVVTQYKGIEVFIPMSHWSLERNATEEPGDVKVGSRINAQILEITDFDTDARRVTATRRTSLRRSLLGSFQPGQRLSGRVSSIHDFGIFVDLGGIDGLVHASEVSHVRGRKPSELVSVGDQVDVVVKEIDQQKERIYLGMRELAPSPWEGSEERYPEGSVQQGKVVGFSKNGTFIELEPGIEGFIRMRELSWTKRAQRPKEILRKGADVAVKVLEISARKQRLSLSYRQAQEDPWPTLAEKYAVGTKWQGEIRELSNKGVVVDIGEVEGFLPRGRMGREAKRLPDMKVGEKLDVNVIEIDPSRGSLIFGMGGEEGGGGGRPERGERSGGGGGGERGERGERRDRGERGDRRDRPTAPPAKPSDEIKGGATVGSFSIGDMLGEAIKQRLGVKEEKPRPERRPAPAEGATEATAAAEPTRTEDRPEGMPEQQTEQTLAAKETGAEETQGEAASATPGASEETAGGTEPAGSGEEVPAEVPMTTAPTEELPAGGQSQPEGGEGTPA